MCVLLFTRRWMEALTRASTEPGRGNFTGAENPVIINAGAVAGGGGTSDKGGGATGGAGPSAVKAADNRPVSVAQSANRHSVGKKQPPAKRGILKKKSPSIMQGWQKRFFVMHEPGDISYYGESEKQRKKTMNLFELFVNF